MPALDTRLDDLAERAQFSALVGVELAVRELHQAGIAGDLTEPRKRREDFDLRFAHALLFDIAHHALANLAEDLLVEDGLLLAERNDDLLFDLLREVGRDVLLEAPKDKGLDDFSELLGGFLITAIDRPRIRLFEALEPAQQSGRDEIEDAPDLAQAVLDRRSRQGEPTVGFEPLRRARGLAERILNVLRLIEDGVAEIELGKELLIAPKQRIARHHHVGVIELVTEIKAIRALPRDRLHGRRELLDLADPVGHDRRRRDNEMEALLLALALRPEKKRDRLKRLSETHIVGQDST